MEVIAITLDHHKHHQPHQKHYNQYDDHNCPIGGAKDEHEGVYSGLGTQWTRATQVLITTSCY